MFETNTIIQTNAKYITWRFGSGARWGSSKRKTWKTKWDQRIISRGNSEKYRISIDDTFVKNLTKTSSYNFFSFSGANPTSSGVCGGPNYYGISTKQMLLIMRGVTSPGGGAGG